MKLAQDMIEWLTLVNTGQLSDRHVPARSGGSEWPYQTEQVQQAYVVR